MTKRLQTINYLGFKFINPKHPLKTIVEYNGKRTIINDGDLFNITTGEINVDLLMAIKELNQDATDAKP